MRGPLTFDLDVDVCVIGGGLAGLTTAREIARRGWSVVVLEADRIAANASGQTEPAPAGEAWARVDHAIVDQVPAVPLYTLRHVDFVSPRVHNYTYNPEYGVLFDQLWAR